MLKIILLCNLILVIVHGHENKIQSDADFQSALMPQELNPVFVPSKDSPWRALLPIPRQRRDTELSLDHGPTLGQQVKTYSRVAACVALAISATVEIILYLVESYLNN